MVILSKTERDYLAAAAAAANLQISDDYSRTIKSRLQKKIDLYVKQELPLLIEKGSLEESTLSLTSSTNDITEFCNVTEIVTHS